MEKDKKPTLESIARKIIDSPFKIYPSLEFGESLKDIKTYFINISFRF